MYGSIAEATEKNKKVYGEEDTEKNKKSMGSDASVASA